METFLRPIGGTMLIKSRRYMRLEAGKGSANLLGREFIKRRWMSSDFKHGALMHDRKKSFAEELFLENVNIELLKAKIEIHFNPHKHNHQEIIRIKNQFDRHKQDLENNRLLKKATTSVEIIQQHKKPELEIEKLPGNSPNKAQLELSINRIKQASSKLYKLVENATKDKVWKDFLKSCPKPLKMAFDNNEIKALMDEIISPVYYLDNNNNYCDYNDNIVIDKTAKRKVLQKTLVILVREHNNKKNPFKITLPDASNLDYSNDQTWNQWVDQIAITEEAISPISSSSNAKKFGYFMADAWNFNFRDWMEQYAWDSTDDGKILISEKKGETLHIDQGMLQAHTFQVPNNELASLKDSLKN